MKKTRVILIVALILPMIAGGLLYSYFMMGGSSANPPSIPLELCRNPVVIVGNTISRVEREGSTEIGAYISSVCGKTPELKRDIDFQNGPLAEGNLVLFGTQATNSIIPEAMERMGLQTPDLYSSTKGNGSLVYFSRNPWDLEKQAVLIMGDTPEAALDGVKEFVSSGLLKQPVPWILIHGTVGSPESSWSPHFDPCISPAPYMNIDRSIFYLKNVCGFIQGSDKIEGLEGKSVGIKGTLESIDVAVPEAKQPGAPMKIVTYHTVINVSSLVITP